MVDISAVQDRSGPYPWWTSCSETNFHLLKPISDRKTALMSTFNEKYWQKKTQEVLFTSLIWPSFSRPSTQDGRGTWLGFVKPYVNLCELLVLDTFCSILKHLLKNLSICPAGLLSPPLWAVAPSWTDSQSAEPETKSLSWARWNFQTTTNNYKYCKKTHKIPTWPLWLLGA